MAVVLVGLVSVLFDDGLDFYQLQVINTWDIRRCTGAEFKAMALPKTIAGRTRPIEIFANAVAKCSVEVNAESRSEKSWLLTYQYLRHRCMGNASWQITIPSTRTSASPSSSA